MEKSDWTYFLELFIYTIEIVFIVHGLNISAPKPWVIDKSGIYTMPQRVFIPFLHNELVFRSKYACLSKSRAIFKNIIRVKLPKMGSHFRANKNLSPLDSLELLAHLHEPSRIRIICLKQQLIPFLSSSFLQFSVITRRVGISVF